jgi:hypothetical protein
MTKLKNIIGIIIFATIIYACGDDNFTLTNPFSDRDYEALAISDNDSIVTFLKSHYYNRDLDTIQKITSGNESMFTDGNLSSIELVENNIDYTLYIYVKEQGNPIKDKGFPSIVDSTFTNYKLNLLAKTDSLSGLVDSNSKIWFNSYQNVRGWAHGLTKLKGGNNITNNEPIKYSNTGKAYFFVPGGLGYPSLNFQIGQDPNERPYDQILIFEIELLDFVKDTDNDNDGIPSIIEDLDNDGDFFNDDTNGDGFPNFLDADDDGDGVFTKDEDANNDGDPTNDFSDPNNPTLPDYLNPNIK